MLPVNTCTTPLATPPSRQPSMHVLSVALELVACACCTHTHPGQDLTQMQCLLCTSHICLVSTFLSSAMHSYPPTSAAQVCSTIAAC